jgi:hypothetical protein
MIPGIGPSDHLVHLWNGQPGVAALTLTVNGQEFHLTRLRARKETTIEIGRALHAGTNTVSVTTLGEPGGSATLLFGNV